MILVFLLFHYQQSFLVFITAEGFAISFWILGLYGIRRSRGDSGFII